MSVDYKLLEEEPKVELQYADKKTQYSKTEIESKA